MSWLTVSKAFFRSRKIAAVTLPSFILFRMKSETSNKAVFVEWPLLKELVYAKQLLLNEMSTLLMMHTLKFLHKYMT